MTDSVPVPTPDTAAFCCRELPGGALDGPCTWPETDCYVNGPAAPPVCVCPEGAQHTTAARLGGNPYSVRLCHEPHDGHVCEARSFHCVIHNTDENATRPYARCFECKHLFVSAQELLNKHNAIGAEFDAKPETNPEKVYTCPECAHDF